MKQIKFILYFILFNFHNLIPIRDPFQFKQHQLKNIDSPGIKHKVIGFGKSGNGVKFVIVETENGTETITQNDSNWFLYK